MANDTSLDVRRAVIRLLRADAMLTDIVPDDRIYPPQTPDKPKWPFIRYGSATFRPERATCMDGAIVVGAVHAFARGPGEDAVSAIVKRMGQILDGANLTTDDGDPLEITVTGGRVLRDTEEANDWHGMVDIEALVVSEG